MSAPGLPDTWYKDDFEILHKDDDKYDVTVDETKHTLTIHDVEPQDQGDYTVEVAGERSASVLLVEGVYRRNISLLTRQSVCLSNALIHYLNKIIHTIPNLKNYEVF